MTIAALALIALLGQPAAVDICTADPASVIRIDSKHGTTARYVLRDGAYQSAGEAFSGPLGADFLTTLTVNADTFSLIFIRIDTPVRSAEQLRAQIARLCALRRNPNAPLTVSTTANGADRRRADREIEGNARRSAAIVARAEAAERKKQLELARWRASGGEAAERRRQLAQAMRRLPTAIEIDGVIRREWPDAALLIGYSDTARLGRVRDAKCRRIKAAFECRIGVTAIVDGEPRYEQADVKFWREPQDASLRLDYELVIT